MAQPTVTLRIGSVPVEAPRKPARPTDGCRWCGEPVMEDGHATQRYVIGHGMSHETCFQASLRAYAIANLTPVVGTVRGPAFSDLLKRPAHRTMFGPCIADGYHLFKECAL